MIKSWPISRPFVGALAALLVGTTTAFAATGTGTLRGKVVEAGGEPLPGVELRLESPSLLGERTAFSTSKGVYSFGSLPPGTYTVAANFSGYATHEHREIRVGIGETRVVPVVLQLESEGAETLIVAAGALLDPTSTETGGRVTSEELRLLPLTRDPWGLLVLIPGIQADRIDVGGSQSGVQIPFTSKGDPLGKNSVWTLDGLEITDLSGLGESATHFDFGTIEELRVITAGGDVTQRTAGSGIHLVTKTNRNGLRGSARFLRTNEDLQADNIPAELEADGFRSAVLESFRELGGELGLPVLRDRLWLWGSASRNETERILITGVPEKTELSGFAAKLNGRITKKNEGTLFLHFNDRKLGGSDSGVTRPPETSLDRSSPASVFKFEDQHRIGSRTTISARVGGLRDELEFIPQGGGCFECTTGPIASRDDDRVWHGTYFTFMNERPQRSGHLDGSHFLSTGNLEHELKFGFEYRKASELNSSFWPGGQIFLENFFGARTALVVFSRSQVERGSELERVSFYAQDTLTVGDVTVNLGLRFDQQSGHHSGGIQEANPWVPELLPRVEIPDGEELFSWTTITPRIGLIYAPDPDLLFKASYAMYADSLDLSTAGLGNPAGIYTSAYGVGDDGNGNGIIEPDQDELFGLYGPIPRDPIHLQDINQVDADLSSPRVEELVIGAALVPIRDFVVETNLTFRRRSNTLWELPLVMDRDGNIRPVRLGDYIPDDTLVGSFTFDGESVSYEEPFHTLPRDLRWIGGFFSTNRKEYHQEFLSVELSWKKRLARGWLLAGSFVWSDRTEHFDPAGLGAFPDPTRTLEHPNPDGSGPVASRAPGAFGTGDVFLDASWTADLRGAYSSKLGLDLGANLAWRQGYPLPPEDTRASDPLGRGGRLVLVSELDALRHDNPFRLDLRVAFGRRVGPAELEIGLELFNAFNSNTVLEARRNVNLSRFASPLHILGPRLVRLGARVAF